MDDWSSDFASWRASDDFMHISLRALRSCADVAKVIALRSEASRISGAGLGEGEVAPGACGNCRHAPFDLLGLLFLCVEQR